MCSCGSIPFGLYGLGQCWLVSTAWALRESLFCEFLLRSVLSWLDTEIWHSLVMARHCVMCVFVDLILCIPSLQVDTSLSHWTSSEVHFSPCEIIPSCGFIFICLRCQCSARNVGLIVMIDRSILWHWACCRNTQSPNIPSDPQWTTSLKGAWVNNNWKLYYY